MIKDEEIWPLTWVYSHFVTFLLHRTYSRLPSWSVRQAESRSMCPLTVNLKNWRKHGRLVEPSVELHDFLNSVFNNYTKKIKRSPHAKPNQTKTNKQINKPKEHPKQSKVPCIATQFLQYTIKYIFRRGNFLWKL